MVLSLFSVCMHLVRGTPWINHVLEPEVFGLHIRFYPILLQTWTYMISWNIYLFHKIQFIGGIEFVLNAYVLFSQGDDANAWGCFFWSSGIHVPSPCCHVRFHRQRCSAFWLLCACASASGIAMAGHDHGKATICVVFPCNCKKIPARRHGHRRHQGQGKDGAFVEKEIQG
jgi:hypothetical protein